MVKGLNVQSGIIVRASKERLMEKKLDRETKRLFRPFPKRKDICHVKGTRHSFGVKLNIGEMKNIKTGRLVF